MLEGATAPYEFMSPTLLSQQPPSPRTAEQAEARDWGRIYEHLESRLAAMRMWRYSWWTFWATLAAFFIPFRYVWLVTANRMWRGSYLNAQIINSHGLLAVRTCAAGMWTGLCSPSRPWFGLGIALPWVQVDADAKAWLKDTQERIYTVLAQSNFYTMMAHAFRDVVVFGTSVPIVYEDAEDVIRLYLPAAGEYYLANGARMTANALYTEWTMTCQQCVDMFTLENCPQIIQKAWENGQYETEFVICRAIEPNFPIARKGNNTGKIQVLPKQFTFREIFWLKSTKTPKPCSKKGYHEIPFAPLIWASVSNDPYGRSPCMDAIGDNKQVQTEDLRKAEFIEKGVRPPMGADPALKTEPNSIMPGHTNYMSTDGGKKGFWPLFEVDHGWLPALTADIEKVEGRIDHCLYVDLFMAISRMEGVQPRNELELTKRDLERLQELGPVVTLAEGAFDTIIQRVMAILERRRMLKPKPKSLLNVPLKFNYVSILKLAQRSAESVAMKDVFTTGGELSSASKAAGVPDPLRVLNLDKAYRRYAEINNLDPDLMFTEDEVADHDKIRAKAQQQAQQPQQLMAGVTAAKTLSETQLPGGNNALGALTQGAGGAGLQ
jgi:hypothetical protein